MKEWVGEERGEGKCEENGRVVGACVSRGEEIGGSG